MSQLKTSLSRLVIPWWDVYTLMDMGPDWDYAQENGLIVPTIKNLWHVPIIQELGGRITCNKVVQTFETLGLKTFLYQKDLDANLKPEYEESFEGSYVTSFKVSMEGDPTQKSANDRWKLYQAGDQQCNDRPLREILLLALGVYMATDKSELLNLRYWTRTRSRFLDGFVTLFYCNPGRVCVDCVVPDYCYGCARVRPAVSCSIMPSGAQA